MRIRSFDDALIKHLASSIDQRTEAEYVMHQSKYIRSFWLKGTVLFS